MKVYRDEVDFFDKDKIPDIEESHSPKEILKTHPDWPGYEFGSQGRIVSCRRGQFHGKFLKGSPERSGHIYVELKGKVSYLRYPAQPVHRLILEAFHGPCPPGKEIACHKNGISNDNRLENLYWGSSYENSIDRHIHNGTFKGGSRSRVSRKAISSNANTALQNSLEEAIKTADGSDTVRIPKALAIEILFSLNSKLPL